MTVWAWLLFPAAGVTACGLAVWLALPARKGAARDALRRRRRGPARERARLTRGERKAVRALRRSLRDKTGTALVAGMEAEAEELMREAGL